MVTIMEMRAKSRIQGSTMMILTAPQTRRGR